jgi:hypothetical protein
LKFKKMPIFIPDAAVFTPVTVVNSVSSLSAGVFNSIGQIDGTNTTASRFNPVGNVVIP